jgi:hypothetical protein
MNQDDLAKVDLAEVNLVCAEDLQGSENLDVAKCRVRLDEWAQRVYHWTEDSFWDFRRNPGKFNNSEARFRVLLLISVLQKDFGVHYNDRGERSCDCSNSKNPFIHGMIDDPNGGTCASMPVIYVAVGRRLGYPMKLVLAKTHIFARWEDATTGERFNIEGTNAQFAEHPDAYYRNWPQKISDAEIKQGWYLKPLAPAEELAVFLQNRGFCLMDTGRFDEARAAFVAAALRAPQDPLAQMHIAAATAAKEPVPRRVGVVIPAKGHVDEDGMPFVYTNPITDIERVNAINRDSMERMMNTSRASSPQLPGVPRVPTGHVGPSPYSLPAPYGSQPPMYPGKP